MGLGDLERHEKLTLVAFLKLLIPADGVFSEDEKSTLDAIAEDLAHTTYRERSEPAPYREAAVEVRTTDGRELMAELLAESNQKFADEDAVKAAARQVLRPEARQLIYGALQDVAIQDCVAPAEAALLHWLEVAWSIK